jgi:hypothetical protein
MRLFSEKKCARLDFVLLRCARQETVRCKLCTGRVMRIHLIMNLISAEARAEMGGALVLPVITRSAGAVFIVQASHSDPSSTRQNFLPEIKKACKCALEKYTENVRIEMSFLVDICHQNTSRFYTQRSGHHSRRFRRAACALCALHLPAK